MSQLQACLFVCGPTASGKSEFAIRLAQNIDGEIVNLDSVQVYRGANIGSAKLSAEQMRGVPHHLLDVVDPDQAFDVAKYRELAIACIQDIQSRGKKVIFCGGSTLYLNALIYGLAELPRSQMSLRKDLEEYSSEDLHAQLVQLDSDRAGELHKNDRLRVIRALESCLLSGGPISGKQKNHGFGRVLLPGVVLVKLKPRDLLYRQINLRSSEMIQNGLIEEVSDLISRFGEEGSLFRALGYAQVRIAREQGWSISRIEQEISQGTRNFAKRQFMFWRNEPLKRGWQDIAQQFGLERVELGDEMSGKIRSKLKSIETSIWTAGQERDSMEYLVSRLQGLTEIEFLSICNQEDLISTSP